MDALKAQAFLAVAKYKSFSKAAEEFNYSPSAFSHIADALEAEVGLKLFVRKHTGVSLTENGMKLYPHFKKIVDADTALKRCAETLSNEWSPIRICSISSVFKGVLYDAVKKFRETYPEAEISLSIGDEYNARLKDDGADVVFSDAPAADDIPSKPILVDPYVAVCASSSVLCNKKVVYRDDLYGHTFLMPKEIEKLNYFNADKFIKKVKIEVDDYETVADMVKDGLGVSVLPLMSVKNIKGIRRLRLEPQINRTLCMNYKAEALSNNKNLKKFITFVMNFVEDGF